MKSNGDKQAATKAEADHGTSTVRLTFRTFLPSLEKLYTLAIKRGWVNGQGKPNLSKALNHLIDDHDVGTVDEETATKAHESAIEFLDKE